MSLKDIFNETDILYTTSEPYERGTLSTLSEKGAQSYPAFFAINPLSVSFEEYAKLCSSPPRTARFSLNVTHFRNFLFESDNMSLEEQLTEWTRLSEILPIKMLTYSGGKSYHAIISVIDELPFEPHTQAGVSAYKQAWKGLKGFIEANSKLALDPSTKDPARLSRTPGAIRSNGNVQSSASIISRYITADAILQLMAKYAPFTQHGAKVTGACLGSADLATRLELRQHRHLRNKIKYPEKWVSSENMYPKIIRLTLWAIDELNPEPQAWLNLLQTTVFPSAQAVGYKRDLTIGVKGAYAYKGIKL